MIVSICVMKLHIPYWSGDIQGGEVMSTKRFLPLRRAPVDALSTLALFLPQGVGYSFTPAFMFSRSWTAASASLFELFSPLVRHFLDLITLHQQLRLSKNLGI